MTILEHNIDSEVDEQDALLIDERMKSLASVYQLADSVLAGEKISVKVGAARGTQAPAWTSGTEIFINTAQIGVHDFDDIVRLHGLNFHELSHVLYTPRAGTVLAKYCIENDLMPAFNMLEDQRIESLLTTKYPSTAPWLTAAVMRWVTNDPQAVDRGYLFVRGRRYLPGELRGLLRTMFCRRDLLSDIDRVVDTYRLLVFPTDYDQAKSLIEQMQRLLAELGTGMPSDPNGHSCAPWHICDSGRPAPVKEQRGLRDRMGSEKADKPDSEKDNEGQDENPSAGPMSGKDGDDQEQGDTPAPSGTDEDSAQPSNEGSQAGTDSAERRHDEIRERVQDMLDALLDSEEVRDDVRRTQRSLETSTGASVLTKARALGDMDPLPEFALMERRLTQTLLTLQQEAEPGWHRREDFGRLNVVRWAIEREVSEAFDRWDEGVTDAVDIEAVIMLDASGSMGSIMNESFNAMWVLKRAFDSVDIATTVITYDGTSEVLYDSQERATPRVRYAFKGGGTNPVDGLNQAMRILSASQRSNKLLIVLTDGEWSMPFDEFGLTSEDYIKRMNDAGFLTALGYIDGYLQDRIEMGADINTLVEQNRHGCRIAGIASGDTLVPFISDIVTGLIRDRIRGAR